jgi:hypothetical protein
VGKHARFTLVTAGLAVTLFLGILLCLEVGRDWGTHQIAIHGTEARTGVGMVDGAVYAMLALLLGFSFNGAAARFDARRALIAQEVNAIGTAWQRIDVLPADPQAAAIRSGMQRYLDALLESYAQRSGAADPFSETAQMTDAQGDLWSRSVAVCITPNGEKARMLLLPALNEMFGIVEQERLARRIHPPVIVYVMLALTTLASSLFAGYGMAGTPTRNWLFTLGVAATISSILYVIVELEYPRRGLVRVDEMDQALVELRTTMR